jgi:hypothetical protein
VFGADGPGFHIARGRPLVSALEQALDEQPDDCQRQPDEHKRQRATDNCCKHMYPRLHFSCTSRGLLVEQKIACDCSFSQRGNSTN